MLEKIHRKSNINFKNTNIPYTSENIVEKAHKEIAVLLNTLNLNEDYSKLKNINKIYVPLKYFFIQEFSNIINTITHTYNCYIYMPCILKDNILKNICEKLPQILSSYSIKGFVVSNISQIHLLENYMKNYEFISNYNMNVYNNYTIEELTKLGISCVTLSPELDKLTLNSLYANIATEAIIYGNLPVMTTNYCLLSKSNFCLEKCKSNCGNSKYTYSLKDRMNMNFRILPDYFSKTTTIFNSKKTSVSINEVNVNFARLDFIDESINEICEIINSFKNGSIIEGKDFTNGNFNRIV